MCSCSRHLTSVTSCRIFSNQKVNLRSSFAVGKLPDVEIVRQINEAQSRLHHSSFLPYSGVEDAEGLPRLACVLQGNTLPARTPFVLIDGPDDMMHDFFSFPLFFLFSRSLFLYFVSFPCPSCTVPCLSYLHLMRKAKNDGILDGDVGTFRDRRLKQLLGA